MPSHPIGSPQNNPARIIPPEPIRKLQSMGPSSVLFDQLYSSNPSFRSFADSMRGKTPEEAFGERGLNFDDFKDYRW